MRLCRIPYLILFLLCFSSIPAFAQDDVAFETGIKPFGSYSGGKIDTTNLLNGNTMIDIPLISYPQRGGKLKLDFVLHYVNLGYMVAQECPYTCYTVGGATWMHGFSVMEKGAPTVLVPAPASCNSACLMTWDFSVDMSDGSSHTLAPLVTSPAITMGSASAWESFDGSKLRLNLNPSSSTAPYLITDSSGIQYNAVGLTPNAWAGPFFPPLPPPSMREDTNGNQISYNSTAGYVDTLGRAIPVPFVPIPTTPMSITVNGQTTVYSTSCTGVVETETINSTTTETVCEVGATQDFSGCAGPLPITSAVIWNPPGLNGGTYTIKFCYVQVSETLPLTPSYLLGSSTYLSSELQSAVLPDGTAWTFQYTTDGNGDLSQVTFPTGGTLSYTWVANEANVLPYLVVTRAVATRTLNPNDGLNPTGTWTHTYPMSTADGEDHTVVATMVTDPAGNTVVHNFTTQGIANLSFPETLTQYFQGSNVGGTLVKTIKTDYQDISVLQSQWTSEAAFPIRATTIWPNAEQTKTESDYDESLKTYSPLFNDPPGTLYSTTATTQPYGNVTATRSYDYGSGAPGALLRTTTTSYLAFSNSAYLANNLLDLPSSVSVTGTGPGSSTGYGYDATTPAPSGITTQVDPNPPFGTALGNLTSVSRWLNTSSTYLTTSNKYFNTGEVQTSTDPKGNPTTYAYSSTYAGAYPTTITNALNQSVTTAYDFNTGLPTSTTDANGQTASHTYDNMLRTAQISNPDAGLTTFSYPTPSQVDITEKINGSQSRLSYLLVDGVGREIRRAITNGESAPYDEADTCYDAVGRVSFKSYSFQDSGPFSTSRSCGLPETGDSFAYDALSRTTNVTHSDGSTVVTSYTARATSVQDEGNGSQRIQRISQVDGMGRLASVCEVTSATLAVGISGSTTPAACGQDIAATGFLTTYAYDALDNLTSVAQGPLSARTFAYDSLSRLTSAANPESGTTTYTYDADGNVATKTDARSTTITYSYDALNRLTGKTFSDSTPAVTYSYDQTSALGITLTNTIGRKSSESTAGSNPTGSVFSYDPMGRVLNNSQCTPQNCSGTPFSFAYTYDLLGDVTSSTNGAGVTLSNTYNAGARLTALTSSLSDANHPPTLLSGVSYGPFGMRSATLGNGLTEALSYAPRGWLQSNAASGAGSALPTTAAVMVNGAVQTAQSAAGTAGSGSVTLTSSNGGVNGNCRITLTVNGSSVSVTAPTSAQSSWQTVDAIWALYNAVNTSTTIPVVATNITWSTWENISLGVSAKTTGSATNYSLAATTSSACSGSSALSVSKSGATLTGGTNAASVSDSGSVSITVNGVTESASYGTGSTGASLASALASAFNGASGSPVTAAAAGNMVTLTSKTTGSGTNYVLSASSQTNNPSAFSSPSFSLSATSPTLVTPGVGYNFVMGYAPNGDVLAANDSVNGNWTYAYDAFNRLTGSNKNGSQVAYGYAYDRFGNRWSQTVTAGTGSSSSLGFTSSNQIASGSGVAYDAAGNTTNDGVTTYTYDAEGRVTTAVNASSGTSTYVYDAEGRRIRKTTVAGGTVDFLYDTTGREVSQISSTGTWTRGEMYAGGRHLATYTGTGGTTYFIHADWLGTERGRSTVAGASYETCASLPFGDALTCAGTEVSPMHFTGKERDTESNLDNFGARYDASSMGRFMSPDPLPWPHWQNGSEDDQRRFERFIGSPQNFDMYVYVVNNPLRGIDPYGEDVYVVLYTMGNTDGDEELKKAALTKANEIKNSKGFDPKKDTVLVEGVKTKGDFKAALNAANGLQSQFGKVSSLTLFSHAGDESGPVFHDQAGHPTQFTNTELAQLTVNWGPGASATFYGCRTIENFAQAFANAQRVSTYGFAGGADFSGTPNTKSKWYVLNPWNEKLYMIDQQEKGLQRRKPQ